MYELLKSLWTDDSAQDMAEYGLLLVLIAVGVIATIILFRGAIINAFTKATGNLNGAS